MAYIVDMLIYMLPKISWAVFRVRGVLYRSSCRIQPVAKDVLSYICGFQDILKSPDMCRVLCPVCRSSHTMKNETGKIRKGVVAVSATIGDTGG